MPSHEQINGWVVEPGIGAQQNIEAFVRFEFAHAQYMAVDGEWHADGECRHIDAVVDDVNTLFCHAQF